MVRSSVSEMRSRSLVTTLRAKGLSEPAIMRHVLRNSFPTLLTVAGLQFGYLMGGSTMVETTFSWPGIGLIIYQSIFTSDFPVTQAAIDCGGDLCQHQSCSSICSALWQIRA